MSDDPTFLECIRRIRQAADAMLGPTPRENHALGCGAPVVEREKWQALATALDDLWPGVRQRLIEAGTIREAEQPPADPRSATAVQRIARLIRPTSA